MLTMEYKDRLSQIRRVLHAVVSSRVGHIGDHSVHTPQVHTQHAAEAVKACDELLSEVAPPPNATSEPELMIFDLDIARAKVVLAACAWCDARNRGRSIVERTQFALRDAVDEYGAILARIEARNKDVQ